MATLVYGDEAIAFVTVSGALTTAAMPAGAAIPATGFSPAASASDAELAAGAQSLLHLADTACSGGPCLRNVFLELDMRVRRCTMGKRHHTAATFEAYCSPRVRLQVPALALKADTLTLYDDAGDVVLEVVVPDNQQIRFTIDDHTVINRIRVELAQTSTPAGDLSRVARVSLTRQGPTTLDTIDSNRRSDVYWHLTSLRLRSGECKGEQHTVGGTRARTCSHVVVHLLRGRFRVRRCAHGDAARERSVDAGPGRQPC